MKRTMTILGLFWTLVMGNDLSVAGERPFTVELRGSYTTTSKVFFNPDAASAFERNRFFEVDDIFGFGVDIRRNVA